MGLIDLHFPNSQLKLWTWKIHLNIIIYSNPNETEERNDFYTSILIIEFFGMSQKKKIA